MKKLFKNRNFLLLFNGALVSSIGDVLFNFAIGLYILDLTHSAFQLSLYGMVGSVTWLLISPLGGVWCDRIDRVKIIYITDLIRGITMLFCGFMMMSSHHPGIIMTTLYLTAVIISINGSLFGPASQALIPMVVTKEDLIHANSLMSLMYNVKDVFGMLLAGVMFALVGPVAIVFLNGISYLLSGLTELFIKVNNNGDSMNGIKRNMLSELLDGFKYIMAKNSGIVVILVLMNLKNLALGPIHSVLLPYLLNEQMGSNEMDLSIIYMCGALGGILGSLIVSKGLVNQKLFATIKQSFLILLLCMIAQCGSFLLFDVQLASYGLVFFIFSLTFILSGVIGIVFYVPLYTMLQKMVEPLYYGRVMALFTMLSAISLPISTMMGGIVIDFLGVVALFVICCSILALALCYLGLVKDKLMGTSMDSQKSVAINS
ncbi:MAG TPA: MFS transporter [Firmicutes bacterium]|nr:MFS transporter [Bacillota bacterium]